MGHDVGDLYCLVQPLKMDELVGPFIISPGLEAAGVSAGMARHERD